MEILSASPPSPSPSLTPPPPPSSSSTSGSADATLPHPSSSSSSAGAVPVPRRPILTPKCIRTTATGCKGRRPAMLSNISRTVSACTPGSASTDGGCGYFPVSPRSAPPCLDEAATEIFPWLYLGNARDATDYDGLLLRNIRYILNVSKEVDPTSASARELESRGFAYRKIDLEDTCDAPIAEYFELTYRFIEDARRHASAVLVHCRRGVSRSATLVISYVMRHQQVAFEEAFDYVKQRRGMINPNLGFILALESLSQSIASKRGGGSGILPSTNANSNTVVSVPCGGRDSPPSQRRYESSPVCGTSSAPATLTRKHLLTNSHFGSSTSVEEKEEVVRRTHVVSCGRYQLPVDMSVLFDMTKPLPSSQQQQQQQQVSPQTTTATTPGRLRSSSFAAAMCCEMDVDPTPTQSTTTTTTSTSNPPMVCSEGSACASQWSNVECSHSEEHERSSSSYGPSCCREGDEPMMPLTAAVTARTLEEPPLMGSGGRLQS